MTLSFKLRYEERLLLERFPENEAYRHQTKRLIPYSLVKQITLVVKESVRGVELTWCGESFPLRGRIKSNNCASICCLEEYDPVKPSGLGVLCLAGEHPVH